LVDDGVRTLVIAWLLGFFTTLFLYLLSPLPPRRAAAREKKIGSQSMPKNETEMVVINKFYELLIWTSNHIVKFPRMHKFTLGDRLQTRLYHILDLLLRAKYSRERWALLQDVNLELESLRYQYRIAKDLNCLPLNSYGFAARAVNEVGKLIGGWIKRSSDAPRQ
jgi:hypothetical protein